MQSSRINTQMGYVLVDDVHLPTGAPSQVEQQKQTGSWLMKREIRGRIHGTASW